MSPSNVDMLHARSEEVVGLSECAIARAKRKVGGGSEVVNVKMTKQGVLRCNGEVSKAENQFPSSGRSKNKQQVPVFGGAQAHQQTTQQRY